MLDYAICEISGKQYKVIPNHPIEVDFLGVLDKETGLAKAGVEVKLLILSEDGKLKIGTPYLKEALDLKFLETVKSNKIRVAKFHAKANFRKVTGNRTKKARIVYIQKKS